MKIAKERTRLIFTDYNELEERQLDDLVGTMDKVFSYKDPDGKMICFPTGMEESVRKLFPKIHIEDRSKTYWDYAAITPVEHNAKPRNQLQIDFIQFVLENANKKRNVAGILSPGTGKANPLSSKIYTPYGYKYMGEIKPGCRVLGSNGKPTTVIGVFPQGVKDIYKITLIDNREAMCTADHLWYTMNLITNKPEVVTLRQLLFYNDYRHYAIPVDNLNTYSLIKNIEFSHREEAQCIMVEAENSLYMMDQGIITHNTFMACYSAIKVGARTLIIVPTSSIKTQWGETLVKMFNVPEEKVKLINSPKDFINLKADFAIVSQASLASLNKTYDLEKIMKDNKFGIKVIDEVQMWFHNIIKVDANSNIANNWYLTGTFGRSGEEENALYQEMFGDLAIFREKEKNPTLFNRKPGNVYGMKPHMHVKMMWTHSGLSKEEIRKVSSNMRYSERAGKWMRYGISVPAYTKLVIPDDGRMTPFLKNCLKVIKMANDEVKYGKMLILTSTIASCDVIYDYVKKMYPDKNIGTINSHNSKEENTRVKAECDIIISTDKSAGTGFDVKGLAKLVVFSQYSSWILTDQISGRLRRRDDGQDTYMWDVVDAQIPQLRAWANNRADVLRRKSKSFKVIDL
jgi:hypothetical protein